MKEEESPEDPKPTKWPLFIEEKTRKLALKEEPDLPLLEQAESTRKPSGTTEKRALPPGPTPTTLATKPGTTIPHPSPVSDDKTAEILVLLKSMQKTQGVMGQRIETLTRELSTMKRHVESLTAKGTQTLIDLDEWMTNRPKIVWQQRSMHDFLEPPPPMPLPPIFSAFSPAPTQTSAAPPKQSQKSEPPSMPQRPLPAQPVRREVSQPARPMATKTISKRRPSKIARPGAATEQHGESDQRWECPP
ncbi:unnamed protein product [Clonostachys rosea f. rosea IK726]|uniref:Uncharacterized protein n=1 Tax=Clonostachys rosea f. rosea IK726 TaxID=1349383 RepID=A0ACA9T990_BIOOC|nr:unnamed protein product [Clonostachys rosea f. rosea IK726]